MEYKGLNMKININTYKLEETDNPFAKEFNIFPRMVRFYIIDLARRKVQFHSNVPLYNMNIECWGLAKYSKIEKYLGEYFSTGMPKKCKTIWYHPTQSLLKYIKLFIDNFTEKELIDVIWS